MAAVTVHSDFGGQENIVCHCLHCFPVCLPWSDGMITSNEDAMIFVLWMLSFKPAFSLSSFTFIKRLFSFSLLSAIRVVSSAYSALSLLLVKFPPAPMFLKRIENKNFYLVKFSWEFVWAQSFARWGDITRALGIARDNNWRHFGCWRLF